MGKMEKTLHGDAEEIHRKIGHSVCHICPMTKIKGSWDVTLGDVRCLHTVFEKRAPKTFVGTPWDEPPPYPGTYRADYDGDDYKAQPHYSMAVTLLALGDEVRLCAITAGGSQDHYFIPYDPGEKALLEALNITLNNLDRIY